MSKSFLVKYGLPEKELERRHKKVRELMSKHGLDLLLISSNGRVDQRGNIRYMSYWVSEYSDYLVFPMEGEMTLLCFYDSTARAARDHFGIQNISWGGWFYGNNAPDRIAEIIKKKKPEVVGLAGLETIDALFYTSLLRKFPNIRFEDAQLLMEETRMVKSSWEIRQIERCARLADEAFDVFCEALKVGRKEYEVLADVDHWLQSGFGPEFVWYLISSGPSPAFKLWWMADRTLKSGDIVGVTWEICYRGTGYWTQLCRTVSLGKPHQKVKETMDVVLEAQRLGAKELRPGKTILDVARAINDYVIDAGHELKVHMGHGQGLDIIEKPLPNLIDNTPLKPGIYLELHPQLAVPLPPGGGALVGDNFLVTETGPRRLFKTPQEIQVL